MGQLADYGEKPQWLLEAENRLQKKDVVLHCMRNKYTYEGTVAGVYFRRKQNEFAPPPSLPAQHKQRRGHFPTGNTQPQQKDAQISKPPGEVWMLPQQMCFSLSNRTGYRMRGFKHAGGGGFQKVSGGTRNTSASGPRFVLVNK